MSSHEFQPSPFNQAFANTMQEKRASKNLNMGPTFNSGVTSGNPAKNTSQSMMAPSSMQQTNFNFGTIPTNPSAGGLAEFQAPSSLLSQPKPAETGRMTTSPGAIKSTSNGFSTTPSSTLQSLKGTADSEKPLPSNDPPFGSFLSSSAPATYPPFQFPKITNSANPPSSINIFGGVSTQEKPSQPAIASRPTHHAFGAPSATTTAATTATTATTTKLDTPFTFGSSGSLINSAASQSSQAAPFIQFKAGAPAFFPAQEKSSQPSSAPASSHYVFEASAATPKSDTTNLFSCSDRRPDSTAPLTSTSSSFGSAGTDALRGIPPFGKQPESVHQPTSNTLPIATSGKADTPNIYSFSNSPAESGFLSNPSTSQIRPGTLDSLPASTKSTESKTQGHLFLGIKEQPTGSQSTKTVDPVRNSFHSFETQGTVYDSHAQRPEGSFAAQSTTPKVESNHLTPYISLNSESMYLSAMSSESKPDGNAGNQLFGKNAGQSPKSDAIAQPKNETKPSNPPTQTIGLGDAKPFPPSGSADHMSAYPPPSSGCEESDRRDGTSQESVISSYMHFGSISGASGGNGSLGREPNRHDAPPYFVNESRVQPRNEGAAPSDPPRRPNPGRGDGLVNRLMAQADFGPSFTRDSPDTATAAGGSSNPPPGSSRDPVHSEERQLKLEALLKLIDDLIDSTNQDSEGQIPSEHAQLFSQDQLTQATSNLKELKTKVDRDTEFTAALLHENESLTIEIKRLHERNLVIQNRLNQQSRMGSFILCVLVIFISILVSEFFTQAVYK